MPEIIESNERDVISKMPDWEVCDDASFSEAGLFIGVVGFEDRSIACFEKWCNEAVMPIVAILVEYNSNNKANETFKSEFMRISHQKNIYVELIAENPIMLSSYLREKINQHINCSTVLLDISSASSGVIFHLLNTVFHLENKKLIISYAEADIYNPKKEEWESIENNLKKLPADALYEKAIFLEKNYFQSYGVSKVYESALFTGLNKDNFPVKLAIIPNFSFERTNYMVNHVRDRYSLNRNNSLIWIFGIPPSEKHQWRYEAMKTLFSPGESFSEVSTLDYKDILLKLNEMWRDAFGKYSFMIATLGSKAQNLGIFMYLVMHKESGLVLSEPREFTVKKYSEGVGKLRQIIFSNTSNALELLEQWNVIEFKWDVSDGDCDK